MISNIHNHTNLTGQKTTVNLSQHLPPHQDAMWLHHHLIHGTRLWPLQLLYNYAVDGNGEIEWFKPDYAKFENTLRITVLENYKERPLLSNMENRTDDIKVYFYIKSWLDNSNQGRSSGTSHAIDNWIETCSNLLKPNRLSNTWPVPVFLPWYWTNITRVTPIFLTFIELIVHC